MRRMSWLAAIAVPWLLFGDASALGSDGFLSPITDTVAELANRTVSASNSTYIIQLVPGSTLERFVAVHPSLASLVFSELRVGLFSAIIGTFDSPLLPYLARSFLVQSISEDLDLMLYEVQSPAPRHLSRLSQKEPLKARGPTDYVYDESAGEDVDIYILDTGINTWSPEFEGRAQFGEDFTGEGPGDFNGHGTCVAGVAASRSFGVAKRANLIDVKIVDGSGHGRLSNALAALQYISTTVQETRRKSVVNISFGTPKNSLFNQAVRELISLDIPVVAAAGNLDTSACRYSPASADGVLVLGAFDDRSDSVAPFSNWGQCVDAFASGVGVESVALTPRKRLVYSGTSVAAPIGAGLVAYYLGMGDTGEQAVRRVLESRSHGMLNRKSLILKPFTQNAVLFNGGGDPLW